MHTSSFFSALLLCSSFIASAQVEQTVNQDSVIFKDGGNLYGKFQGFDSEGKIQWNRDKADGAQNFPTDEISQISINGGKPVNSASTTSYIELTNGDLLPGTISSLSDDEAILTTSYSGKLNIARKFIRSYHPSPHGSALIINGFGKHSGWESKPFLFNPRSTQTNKIKKWELHGASYYTNSFGTSMLINPKIKHPDDLVIKFDYAYQGKPSLNLAFFADMQNDVSTHKKEADQPEDNAEKPENAKEDEGEKDNNFVPFSSRKSGVANSFGNCLALTIGSNFNSLSACGVSEDNSIYSTRQESSIPRTYSTPIVSQHKVEIRASRKRRQVSLFIDDKHTSDWSISEKSFPTTGSQLGFYTHSGSQGNIRVSNLLITKWHGVFDSPASMQSPHKDIVLMSNHTDRIAAEVSILSPTTFALKTSYADFKTPQENVKTINFSTENLEDIPLIDRSCSFLFFNQASVTGQPISSEGGKLNIKTNYTENVQIPITELRGIIFEEVPSLIKSWSNKF